ncbi:SseB family protein [Streptomyces sp. NPDC048106]|uniref:SseB family protein n=1 Tax=Streptomyces sp. NPDC048106 TaxID=3155750 RepID=UPI003455B498
MSDQGDGTVSTTGARDRRRFAAFLGEFRRTAVLVPVDEHDVPLTGDHGGVRWILAFSSEAALARYALARGEGDREWAYQRWLGARLLDAAVPAVGVPCGVALDVGGAGALFPPVAGIVPDRAAVDVDGEQG